MVRGGECGVITSLEWRSTSTANSGAPADHTVNSVDTPRSSAACGSVATVWPKTVLAGSIVDKARHGRRVLCIARRDLQSRQQRTREQKEPHYDHEWRSQRRYPNRFQRGRHRRKHDRCDDDGESGVHGRGYVTHEEHAPKRDRSEDGVEAE